MSLSLLNQSAREGTSGQNLRMLAQRLAAYIPTTLTRKILQDEPIVPGRAEMITAATMFADMSGFTHVAEALTVDGARGTEALSRRALGLLLLVGCESSGGGDGAVASASPSASASAA